MRYSCAHMATVGFKGLKLQSVPQIILLLSALKAVKHKQQITLSGAMATVVTLSLCASTFSSSELDDKSNI